MRRFIKSLLCTLLLTSALCAQSDTESTIDSSMVKSPGKALLFSFIPGGGQVYNHRFLKAILFSGAFTYYAIGYNQAQNDYQVDPTDQTLHRTRNDKIWMMSLVWTLNIIDAYVDAQLWDFDKYDIDADQLPEVEYMTKPKEVGNTDDTE